MKFVGVSFLLLSAAVSVSGFNCGVDDPAFQPLLSVESVQQQQDYDTEAQRQVARQLAERKLIKEGHTEQEARSLTSQSYGAFVSLSTPEGRALAAPIRIAFVWDPIINGDLSPGDFGQRRYRQCSFVGQSIHLQDAGGAEVLASNFCKTQHLVTGSPNSDGGIRGGALRERSEAARIYWQQTLKIRRVQDAAINIDASVVSAFNLSVTSVPNADLVIIMTARPSPNRPVAGYASCRQRDQYNRCTVGWFNWVPELVATDDRNNPEIVNSEMHVALHELMHVLGGMYPAGATPFIDASGNVRDPRGNVYMEEFNAAYNKYVTLIVTPRVLNVSRTAFGCDSMNGFPLEDVELGRGSHWEARLAGPELMSYGTGSGQTYVSDLTFAYLEDTNQYVANYSMGGKLTPDGVDDFKTSGLTFTQTKDSTSDYQPPAPPSPGALTWGRGQGCTFVNGNARAWPSTYTCSQNQEYGCTPDNRMSAVCVIKTDFASETSCASWYLDQTSGSLQCGQTNDACSGGSCKISSSMRYFTSDDAARAAAGVGTATAASSGGYSSSMDYAPVRVGYWACNAQEPMKNVSAGPDGSVAAGLNNFVVSLFGSQSDMASFGGQARCPQCRCMRSSLMELTKSITPSFKIYGLCYRTNCYRSDYLQVAVKGQFSKNTVFWYKCPTAGGKIYITGFTGSLHCPPAEDFCAGETVTGIKYPEQSFIFELIFWGTVTGTIALFSLCCICPCMRDRMIIFFKRLCGAMQFPTEYQDIVENGKDGKTHRRMKIISSRANMKAELARAKARKAREQEEEQDRADRLPSSCASWYLFIINMLTMMVGLAMIGFISYQIYYARLLAVAIPLLGVSTFVCMVAFVGIWASRKRADYGPSCWLLSYFYFNVFLTLLLVWTIAYNLSYANWTGYIDRNWDIIVDVLPAKYRTGTSRDAQVQAAVKTIEDNMATLGAMAISVLVVYMGALVAAAKLLHVNTIASMTLTISNNLLILVGVILSAVGFYLLAGNGRAGGAVIIVAIVLATGLTGFVVGIIGSVAVFKKKRILLGAYSTAIIFVAGFFAYAIWVFVTQSGKVRSYVDSISDDELSGIANDIGLSMSKSELQAKLQDSLHQLTLTAAVAIGVCLIIFFASVIYSQAVRREDINARLAAVPEMEEREEEVIKPLPSAPINTAKTKGDEPATHPPARNISTVSVQLAPVHMAPTLPQAAPRVQQSRSPVRSAPLTALGPTTSPSASLAVSPGSAVPAGALTQPPPTYGHPAVPPFSVPAMGMYGRPMMSMMGYGYMQQPYPGMPRPMMNQNAPTPGNTAYYAPAQGGGQSIL